MACLWLFISYVAQNYSEKFLYFSVLTFDDGYFRANPLESIAVTDVLPTPPFPDKTTILCLIGASLSRITGMSADIDKNT